jgi:hypothetical protein
MIVELSIATNIPAHYLQQYDEETLLTYVDVLEKQYKAQHG